MCMCNTYVYIYIHIHIYIHTYIYVYISYEIYIYYHIRDIYIALIQCQIIGDGKPWKAHIPNIIQTILRTGNTLELLYIYVYLFAGLLGYIPVPSDFLIPVLVPVMGFFTPAVSRLFSIRVSHAESHSCFPICRPSESLRSMNGIRHQFLWL